jgi:hypothetical protein
MFGKKKVITSPVRDFHCGVCGIDCSDGDRLARHVNWAHPGPTPPRTESKDQLVGSARKA